MVCDEAGCGAHAINWLDTFARTGRGAVTFQSQSVYFNYNKLGTFETSNISLTEDVSLVIVLPTSDCYDVSLCKGNVAFSVLFPYCMEEGATVKK